MHPIMSAHRHRSAGFGLLEALLLTFVLGGVLINGAFWLKAQTESRRIEVQTNLLRIAQQQVDAYAARFYQLPCPATASSNGVSDCSAGHQKGLFPYRTLGLEPSADLAGITRLAYMVSRTGAVDLTTINNTFEATKLDGSTYNLGRINTLDFCQNLSQAAKDTSSGGIRVFTSSGGGPLNHTIAYAIAHPGNLDADGDGNLFDGRNASLAAEMDDAGSLGLDRSDDQVVSRQFSELYAMNSCAELMDSVNNMGLANEVASEVGEQKAWNLVSAGALVGVNYAKMLVAQTKAGLAAATMGAAIAALSAATTALSGSIAACVVIIGCFTIPVLSIAVATGATAIISAGYAVAANLLSVAAMATALVMSEVTFFKAGGELGASSLNMSDATNTAKKAWDDASAAITKKQQEKQKAETEKNKACETASDTWGWLMDWAHFAIWDANDKSNPKPNRPQTLYDSDLIAVRSKLYNFYLTQLIVDEKQADYDRAKKLPESSSSNTSNERNDLINKLNTELNNERAKANPDQDLIRNLEKAIDNITNQTGGIDVSQQINNLKSQIASLQSDINGETDPDRKAQKQKALIDMQRQLASLDTSLSGKEAALNEAKANRDSAKTTYENARDNVIEKFNLYYCTTTETKDKDGKVVSTSVDCTHHVDYRGEIRRHIKEINGNIEDSYPKCWIRTDKYNIANDSYNQSVTAADQAKAAYEQFRDFSTGTTPTSTLELKIWSGGEGALQAVEAKGGMK